MCWGPDADIQELDIVASGDSDGQKGDDYSSGGDFTDEGEKIVDADIQLEEFSQARST